ncbi:Hippocampus abundant transcript-like protein 1 [Seminavis robusta]|uniref:Hippocampus abundant transcript-like protein 1 n=1 Tax=Seminavis robusta TaxID=568900 RepID=A0A9N8H4L7_9STRA|nr:Hippocampus abundant transcript-like protein 1 [Seminavis robusta]|eukprot:Sro53_g031500.1 Hippocampus abundant transcript-like protein 1 (628) ;mRNA; r:105982-107865
MSFSVSINNTSRGTSIDTPTPAPTPTPTASGAASGIPSMSLGASRDNQRFIEIEEEEEERSEEKRWEYLYVLPVLLLEFLALALTRAVLPSILLQQYGDKVYLVLGSADCVRGLLAFVACPFFGKLSDVIGRKICLFITVLGTCAPVCSLALFAWDTNDNDNDNDNDTSTSTNHSNSTFWQHLLDQNPDPDQPQQNWMQMQTTQQGAITTFVVLLALSGIFSSTFTLVFAYISDTVHQQDERVSAYGLALATFGLSFTIGPMAGGYLAQSNTHYVFLCSLFFTVLDLLYIYFVLPESKKDIAKAHWNPIQNLRRQQTPTEAPDPSHNVWSPWNTLRLMAVDPFLRNVGKVAFLYYTGLWAIISTLSVYAVKRFHLSPERLGELMSALGLCTMVAEAVLVRIIVPMLGEKQSTKLGLIAFLLQCVVLGLAYEGWHLFLCTVFSMFANLVYPSLSSLVSGSVPPEAVGEALGAINGVKALTEGIGPLVFGSLMTLSEHSMLPGWPYLLAAVLAYFAYLSADNLPDPEDDEYIHELERKKQRRSLKSMSRDSASAGILLQHLISTTSPNKQQYSLYQHERNQHVEEEDQGLLSDVEESEDGEFTGPAGNEQEDVTRLPITFASLVNLPPP